MQEFARSVVRWQRRHGRHDLPWQRSRDPYRIWVSEVMLQQTRVEAVIPYYGRFLARFPDVRSLARAREGEVLGLWSGLGYYARARNLRAAVRHLVAEHAGRFPHSPEALAALPGVGRSTAAAVAVFAFGRRAAILDGNVRRVLARCFGVDGYPGEPAVARRLWGLAEAQLPQRSIRAYTQGLMDLGAMVCLRRQPRCALCPLAPRCEARKRGRIDRIPAPRPKKTLPVRVRRWLLLLHRGRVLLERQPPAGLWGGLWAFPQAKQGEFRSIVQALGCGSASMQRLPSFEHGFSHFRLRVHPLLIRVRAVHGRNHPGQRWIRLAEALRDATPAPVRKLLQTLAGGQ